MQHEINNMSHLQQLSLKSTVITSTACMPFIYCQEWQPFSKQFSETHD